MRRLVVKFGGTSIKNGKLVRKAARSIKKEMEKNNTQIAVVVSAMGGTTNTLIEAAKEGTKGEITDRELDSIMAMGEKVSAKVFASTLRSLGVDSTPITTEDSEWPIITDDKAGNATPNLEKTEEKTKEKIVPLMEKGTVPVICGFIGKNENGNVTTIGRGGSDITAFLTAKCIGATDVVLVTDAEGVMSADPRIIKNTEILERISAEELCDLARYGSRIVHHNALRYKDPNINAKVIHFRHGNLTAEGTIIEASIPSTSKANAELYSESLSMLTVVGESMQTTPGILADAVEPLSSSNINIFGISIGPRSFSVYVTENQSEDALNIIHETIRNSEVMKSTTIEDGIAMILTESEKFIDTPGIISELSDPLAENGINVVEIYSSQASITFFVSWKDRNKALELLKGSIEEVI